RPMPGARDFVSWLQDGSSKVVLVTGGPREVAESALALFDADAAFSNEFHYEDGIFTGAVTIHVSPRRKGEIVRELAAKWGIRKDEILAVGDGMMDVPLLTEAGTRLAHDVRRDLSDLDLVIVPGGQGREEVVKDPNWLQSLLDFGTEKPVASVCTGALILMAAGLLAGRKATTHRSAMDELRGTAQVVDQRIVEDGLVTTAGGVTASIDLGLHLLLKHFGPELADEVAEHLE